MTVGYGPQPSLRQATGRPAERAWARATAVVSRVSPRGPPSWATTKRLARSWIRQPRGRRPRAGHPRRCGALSSDEGPELVDLQRGEPQVVDRRAGQRLRVLSGQHATGVTTVPKRANKKVLPVRLSGPQGVARGFWAGGRPSSAGRKDARPRRCPPLGGRRAPGARAATWGCTTCSLLQNPWATASRKRSSLIRRDPGVGASGCPAAPAVPAVRSPAAGRSAAVYDAMGSEADAA